MKKIFITLIFCTLAVSNSVSRTSENPITIYYFQSYTAGVTLKSYIILKGLGNNVRHRTFEKYSQSDLRNTIGYSVFGEWEILNDTLFLTAKYETVSHGEKTGNIQSVYDKGYLNVNTIPQQFIIKENSIVDITDYDLPLGTGQANITFYEFKRLWGGNLWDYVAK